MGDLLQKTYTAPDATLTIREFADGDIGVRESGRGERVLKREKYLVAADAFADFAAMIRKRDAEKAKSLKCPHCNAACEVNHNGIHTRFWVACTDCGVPGPWKRTEAEAISAFTGVEPEPEAVAGETAPAPAPQPRRRHEVERRLYEALDWVRRYLVCCDTSFKDRTNCLEAIGRAVSAIEFADTHREP